MFELLRKEIQELIKDRFEKPTEIQKIAIPLILSGKNVLISAPTGYGKTEAAFLPALSKILENPIPISIIYITPLRALNRDLLERLNYYSKNLNLEIAVRHSDTSKYERTKQSQFPPHILITTPETFHIIFHTKNLRNHLKNVKFVIIDEIHEICDNKRGLHLSISLERLREIANFQTIMISATISNFSIGKLFCKDFEIASLEKIKEYEFHIILEKEFEKRIKKIVEILEKYNQVLIFTNTREEAEFLAYNLKKYLNVEVHHSSLSREVRMQIEKDFKQGKIKAIVATSSLQLGIDIGNVDAVIQYNSAREVIQLVQRVGRSGHRENKKPIGIIICSDELEYEESKNLVKFAKEGKLEKLEFPKNSLDVIANHILSLCKEKRYTFEEIKKIIKKSVAFENIKDEEIKEVLNFLKVHKLLFEDNLTYKTSKKGFKCLLENLSLIPSIKQYEVIDITSNRVIAKLDENFVVTELEIGNSYLIKGSSWKVVDIDEEKVYVEPSEEEAIVPSWEGELIPVSYEVAKEIENSEIFEGKKVEIVFDGKHFYYIFHLPYGNRVNETLMHAILFFVSKVFKEMFSKSLQYGIIFRTKQRNDEIFKLALENLDKNLEAFVIDSVKNSKLFYYKFFQIAKRFGIISQESKLSFSKIKKLAEFYRNSVIEKEVLNEIIFEKLDFENAKRILNDLKNLKLEFREKFSKFSELLLKRVFSFSEIPMLEANILEKIKNRLLNTELIFLCLNCKNIWKRKVKEIDFEKCIKCNSPFVSILKKEKDLESALKILKKVEKGLKLEEKEKEFYQKLYDSATLFNSFGKKAALVLAGKGIGIETAKKILNIKKVYDNENKLIEEIFEKEKEFIRIRHFLE
ncbi:MAG: DEAD/DEAH box helicase [Candidatus Aenigmatarchaeota archaeon]